MGTVTIYRVYFREEDIHDGDIPRDNVWTDVFTDLDVSEAADILIREGLSFAATGTGWAADPDGSFISNYRTGERCETTGCLAEFSDTEISEIIARVG